MAEKKTYTVEAVLSARDSNFSNAFDKANDQVEDLKNTLATTDKPARSVKDSLLGVAGAIGVTKALSTAWGYLKNNIGGALNRLDTMENFQRTIRLMTGDTDKASKALDDLGQISKGTAYGLDTMATATQGFVTSAYKVEDATRYVEGWGNAIATFGSGTDAALSQTMYQLNQLASKGKANLGDLKTAMEQGIPVLQIYAEQTGKTTEEVSAAISQGAITATEFLETMDEAFRNGTKSFPPLTNAAKNAGSSWSASFANMGAATKRGIASIVTSIENGRKSANLPGMKDSISAFGKGLESTLNSISKVTGHVARNFEEYALAIGGLIVARNADKWIQDLRGSFALMNQATEEGLYTFARLTSGMEGTFSITKLYSNAIKSQTTAEELRNAAKKIGITLDETMQKDAVTGLALTKAQKTAIVAETGAMSLKSVALGVLTGNIKLSTAAQLLWNRAITANPIGMLIAGVVALGSGLVALNRYLNKTSEEQAKANEEAEEYKNSVQSTVNSIGELSRAHYENVKATKANAKEAKSLVKALDDISKESGDATTKQIQMQNAVNKLNKLYPELKAELDDTGTAIKGGTERLKEYIKAEEELTNNSHQLNYLDELKAKEFELNAQRDMTKAKMAELQRQGLDTQKAFFGIFTVESDAMKRYREALEELNTGIDDVKLDIEALNNSTMSNAEVMEHLKTVYGITSEAIIQYSQRTGEGTQEVATRLLELGEQYGITADEIIADVERQNLSIDEWVTKHEELEKAKQKLNELSTEYGLTSEQIINSANAMGLSLEEWESRYSATLDRAKDAINDFSETTLTGLQRLEQGSAISLEEYMNNLRANTEATRNWTANTQTLMEAGISGGVIKELAKLGPEGAKQAEAFVKELEELNGGSLGKFDELNEATKAKLKELGIVYDEGFQAAADAAKAKLEAEDYAAMGEVPPQAVANAYLNERQRIEDAVEEVFIDTPTNTLRDTPEIYEDSMDKNNRAVDAGFSKMNRTIQDASSEVKDRTEQMVNGIVKSFEALPDQMYRSGENAGIGFLNGLWSTSGRIYSLASQIANTVASRINAALQIHSPSRKLFKAGKYTGQGFEEGMEYKLPSIKAVADKYSNIPLSIESSYTMQSLNQGDINIPEVKPAIINLSLGKHDYTVFVEDLTDAQDKKVALQLAY